MAVLGYPRPKTPILTELAATHGVRRPGPVLAPCAESLSSLLGLAASSCIHGFSEQPITLQEILAQVDVWERGMTSTPLRQELRRAVVGVSEPIRSQVEALESAPQHRSLEEHLPCPLPRSRPTGGGEGAIPHAVENALQGEEPEDDEVERPSGGGESGMEGGRTDVPPAPRSTATVTTPVLSPTPDPRRPLASQSWLHETTRSPQQTTRIRRGACSRTHRRLTTGSIQLWSWFRKRGRPNRGSPARKGSKAWDQGRPPTVGAGPRRPGGSGSRRPVPPGERRRVQPGRPSVGQLPWGRERRVRSRGGPPGGPAAGWVLTDAESTPTPRSPPQIHGHRPVLRPSRSRASPATTARLSKIREASKFRGRPGKDRA